DVRNGKIQQPRTKSVFNFGRSQTMSLKERRQSEIPTATTWQRRKSRFVSVWGCLVASVFLVSPGFAWGQSLFLGGEFFGRPSCAGTADSTGDVTCAVIGTDNALYGKRFNPLNDASFPPDEQFQLVTVQTQPFNVVGGNPSCASASNGEVTCAFRSG